MSASSSPNSPASKRRSRGTTARATPKRCVRSATAPSGISGSSKAWSERRQQPPSPSKLVELVDRDCRRGCEGDAGRFRERGRSGERARIVRQIGDHNEIDTTERRIGCLQLAAMLLEQRFCVFGALGANALERLGRIFPEQQVSCHDDISGFRRNVAGKL